KNLREPYPQNYKKLQAKNSLREYYLAAQGVVGGVGTLRLVFIYAENNSSLDISNKSFIYCEVEKLEMLNERINIENIDGQLFEIKIIEPDDTKPASFTHYLHNHKNGVSRFYKKD